MNMQERFIRESFEALLERFTVERSCAFLQASWLLDKDSYLQTEDFERFILLEGNDQEVYSKTERHFIRNIVSEIGKYQFEKETRQGLIGCQIVAASFTTSTNNLYNSVAFMKILNKAFDKFNVCVCVFPEEVYLGCSFAGDTSAKNCVLSIPIRRNIRWDLLSELFLYRDNSNDFFAYYVGMINLLEEISECYPLSDNSDYDESQFCLEDDVGDEYSYENLALNENEDDDIENLTTYYFDDTSQMPVDRYSLQSCIDYGYQHSEACDTGIPDVELFEKEFGTCLAVLSYIKSTRVNSLEILFESEQMELQSQVEEIRPQTSAAREDKTLKDFSLLDDPIALMKKLKKDRGLQ